MTVIRIWLRSQTTEYDIKYKYMHNTGTVSPAILMEAVQQIHHTWFIYMDSPFHSLFQVCIPVKQIHHTRFTMVCKSLVSKCAVVIQHWPIVTITNDVTSILIGQLQIFRFCLLTNDLQTTVYGTWVVSLVIYSWKQSSRYITHGIWIVHSIVCFKSVFQSNN